MERREVYYKPSRCAAELGVTPRTIVRWIREGRLKGVKAGRVWRVPKTEWEAYLASLGT